MTPESKTTSVLSWSLKKLGAFLGYGSLAVLLALLAGVVAYANHSADLAIWHTATLSEEYREQSDVANFDDYLELEDRLFAELQEKVIKKVPPEAQSQLNRFTPGSASSPSRFSRNWNRSYELPGTEDGPGVLLLHGMSDSPYSLRQLALSLNTAGAHVIGLRLPGHGTAPVGLTTARWQDMAAATRLAVASLKKRVNGRPVFLVGYSNGGALSVEYALQSALDESRPQVSGVVLFSPAIGITPVAALANWQERLGQLLGMDKLLWTSVIPEYDPYKYQSFAVNAGKQSYELTIQIASLLGEARKKNRLEHVAPILAFQSAVDATVSSIAVVEGLFEQLPDRGHELTIFDVNREVYRKNLLTVNSPEKLLAMQKDRQRSYSLAIVTNETPNTSRTEERKADAGSALVKRQPLDLTWPPRVFSLSHVALPFAPKDPLYGDGRSLNENEVRSPLQLGALAARGEKGVLEIPAADLLRQRWNPFYDYAEQKVLKFTRRRGTRADKPHSSATPVQ